MMTRLLTFYFLLLPFQFALSPSIDVDLALSRVAALLLGAFFLAERSRLGSWILPHPKYFLSMAGFCLLAFLSMFWAEELNWTLRKAFFLLSFLPIWLVCVDTFGREGIPAIRRVASGFFFGSVMAALLALTQFVAALLFPLNQVLDFWLHRIYPIFLGEAFAQSVAIHPSFLVNIGGTTILRAVGAFPDPHVAAYYLGMAIPFGWWLGMTGSRSLRPLFFSGAGILFLADLATFSRGGYMGLFAMTFFFAVFSLYQCREKISAAEWKRALIGLSCILLLVAVLPPVRDRLLATFSVTEGSNAERIALWQDSFAHIAERPLLGVGLGNYPLVVRPSADYREPIYIHNTYLDIWAELGLVGLLFFLALFFIPVIRFFFSEDVWSIAFPATLALVFFLAHSLFENVLFSVHIFPLLLFLIATLSWYNRGK